MIHALYGVLGLFFGLVVAAMILSHRVEKLHGQVSDALSLVLAAEWLARYNYGYYAAMQDVMLSDTGANYHALQGRVLSRLVEVAQYGTLGQLIPLDRVPSTLREAAKTYNRRVSLHWPLPYSQVLGERGETEARIQQLQDAVATLRMLDSEAFDSELLSNVARRCGTSVAVVEACLIELQAHTHNRADHILGVVDPEDVLPSLY